MDKENDFKKKWNQTEATDGTKFKHGKFTPEEVDMLKNSICQYVTVIFYLCCSNKSVCKNHNLGLEGLRKLVSEENSNNDHLGVWNTISESIPLRSVKSCHNLAKRLFNPLNYKGHWTAKEEQQLLQFFFF